MEIEVGSLLFIHLKWTDLVQVLHDISYRPILFIQDQPIDIKLKQNCGNFFLYFLILFGRFWNDLDFGCFSS